MTPKVKAKHLVDKMQSYTGCNCYVNYEEAKQCALIAVDEMIIQNGELYTLGIATDYYKKKNAYLFQVKNEIEKL